MAHRFLFLVLAVARAAPSVDVHSILGHTPVKSDSLHYTHHVHKRSVDGRHTVFKYATKLHNRTILPHAAPDGGIEVVSCFDKNVTLRITDAHEAHARSWLEGGHLFSVTKAFGSCPHHEHGRASAVHRRVISATKRGGVVELQTETAHFFDLFEELELTVHTSHMPHNTSHMQHNSDGTDATDGGEEGSRRRRLGVFDSIWAGIKNVFTNIGEAVKMAFTGDGDISTKGSFDIMWEYKDEWAPSKLKSFAEMKDSYWKATPSYKLEVHVNDYKLTGFHGELAGSMDIRFNPKSSSEKIILESGLWTIFRKSLWDTVVMIGPVPLVIRLDLDVVVDAAISLNPGAADVVLKAGGHFSFGQKYTVESGWVPLNDHGITVVVDSANVDTEVDMTMGLSLMPTMTFEGVATVQGPVRVGYDYKSTLASGDNWVTHENCPIRLDVTPTVQVGVGFLVQLQFFGGLVRLYRKQFGPKYLTIHEFESYGKCTGTWVRRQRSLVSGSDETPLIANGRRMVAAGKALVADKIKERKAMGRNEGCPGDCGGRGYCLNATDGRKACACLSSWGGPSCTIPAGSMGATRYSAGTVLEPQPMPDVCTHVPIDSTVAVSRGLFSHRDLRTCGSRTSQIVCASGDATEMRAQDATIAENMREIAPAGPSCVAALAEVQCRAAFPGVQVGTGLLMPVSFESCVALLSTCLGLPGATEGCRAMSPAVHGGQAAVSSSNSPYATVDLPSLSHAIELMNSAGSCPATSVAATSCKGMHGSSPSYFSRAVYDTQELVNLAVDTALDYAEVQGSGTATCKEARRVMLCAAENPPCDTGSGLPLRVPFEVCMRLVTGCPSISVSGGSVVANSSDAIRLAESFCASEEEFWPRNFVGQNARTCGIDSVEMGALLASADIAKGAQKPSSPGAEVQSTSPAGTAAPCDVAQQSFQLSSNQILLVVGVAIVAAVFGLGLGALLATHLADKRDAKDGRGTGSKADAPPTVVCTAPTANNVKSAKTVPDRETNEATRSSSRTVSTEVLQVQHIGSPLPRITKAAV